MNFKFRKPAMHHKRLMRIKRISTFTVFCTMFSAFNVAATDIDLVALSKDKAMLIIDGKAPKNFLVGSIIFGKTKLLSTSQNSATIESDGKKQVLYLGHTTLREPTEEKNLSTTLLADASGLFVTQGRINGGREVKMIVDTGASFVSIPVSDAIRLGIDYKNGIPSRSLTANGIARTYLVRLESVKVGGIELFQVEASIHENLPYTLLGMSFLKRVTMIREGQQMVLTKKL